MESDDQAATAFPRFAAGIDVRRVSTVPEACRGTETRRAVRLPFTVCILDRRQALVPLDLIHLLDGFTVVTEPTVVRALAVIHASFWDAASAGTSVPDSLSVILPLLAEGLSDAAAAQRAGLSDRTYSRRVGDLLVALDARTRFAAGVEASRRRWV